MVLFVDKLDENQLMGIINDKRKAEYLLSLYNMSFEKILSEISINAKLPSGMFHAGKYVVSFNFERDLSKVNFGIISYEIDLDSNFDTFADCFPPKAVAGFHQMREIIKKKNLVDLNKVELSMNDFDFEVYYQNYLSRKS